MNTSLVIGLFVCCLFMHTNALQCNSGVDGSGPVKKEMFSPLFMCCYKYSDTVFQKYTFFGAVPPGLTNRACPMVGSCFFSPELNKNVCVCANADDPNCQPDGPVTLPGNSAAASTPKGPAASASSSPAASASTSPAASTTSSSAASTTPTRLPK